MISLKNVTKYYRVNGSKNYILKNVTLDIPSNTNVGIIGKNGAGKSTLLRMIGGIDFPNSGKIESDKKFSWPMALSGGFQGSLSGKENAQFVCRFYGKSHDAIREALAEVEEFSELGKYFYMPIKTYSTGMKSRLGFAMSMAFDFDYYLIDETLSVGDKYFKEKCQKKIKQLQDNKNILLVNHGMAVLKNMCDSGILLNDGEMQYFENIDDAIKEYNRI
ncbi:MAG: ABC transporter ATP-binding protein [Desulfobacteraceae bacterium]|nr:ABC transporter ATP-binding protein [Desulfobacteraceae bacterium]